FVFISGVSSRYSKNNIKRGLIVLAVAAAMTVCTFFFMRSQIVVFGVLHLLGLCMVLHGLVYRGGVEKSSAFFGFIICLVLYALTWGVSDGYIGFFGIARFIELPDFLHRHYFLSPLGFLSPDFYSSDYFPVLPWLFLFFAGSFLGVAFRQGSMPGFFYRRHSLFLRRIGRHTLIIYILHQPVLYGLLTLVFMVLEKSGLYIR
ncbi:MAG: DUF1624 domain-containing protein, partial [Oscillospiraceae bacterium]|nr:DUF1624 domain-containing protein [Oscillospiraceae bacterium]